MTPHYSFIDNNKCQSKLKVQMTEFGFNGKGVVLAFKHLDFDTWNLLGLALRLLNGDYQNLEVKHEDD